MARQVSYPGIYFDEFAPGAPIQPATTNIVAFIGPTSDGIPNQPQKITSFDDFKDMFCPLPLNHFNLWFSVRGFYENGGNECYIVRASNGTYSTTTLLDSVLPAANRSPSIEVRARQPGALSLSVQVTRVNVLSTTLFSPTGALAAAPSSRDLSLKPAPSPAIAGTSGGQFRVGDAITIANKGETRRIVRVMGDTLRVDTEFAQAYAMNDQVRLAILPVGTQTLRLDTASSSADDALVPGAVLTIGSGSAAESHIADSVTPEFFPSGKSYRVTFRDGLTSTWDPKTTPPVNSEEFTLAFKQGTTSLGTYANLSIDPAHPRYFASIINDDPGAPVTVSLSVPPSGAPLPKNLPAAIPSTAFANMGNAENLATLTDVEYQNALDALAAVDEVSLIACPDRVTTTFQQALLSHCELLGDRFAVLDPQVGLDLTAVEQLRSQFDSARGYAALYYPWIKVAPLGAGEPRLIPPSGHICGVISRTDELRGVFKAPAGIGATISGAIGVERSISTQEHGDLNLLGINVIRAFPTGGRPSVWGARTTATTVDSNWQYVNIRRLFLFLERSILLGLRWAIFEPNNPGLWEKLRRTLTDFLTRVWRDGGLFGIKAEEAFYVRIDEALNPDSDRALGRLTIEIGVRPSYPAEFIIVRIGIWYGGSQVSEQ